MTIKVGEKEYCLNHSELQKMMIEIYQQGKKYVISEMRKLEQEKYCPYYGFECSEKCSECDTHKPNQDWDYDEW